MGYVQLVDQANTFALSFRLARISSDCDILLRRSDISISQTENTRSTYACEAGAATKSNANFDCYHFSFYIVSVFEIFLVLV